MVQPSKVCSTCGVDRPLDEYHRQSGRPDGRRSNCKACVKAYTASRKDERRAYHRSYYLANKETILARTSAYQADLPPERSRGYSRKYHAANREKRREYSKHYRAADPERTRAQAKAFRERHPDKARRDQHARRASMARVDHDPAVTIEALRERDGEFCCYCSRLLDFEADQYAPNRATLEHITPISRGGHHSFENTAVACRSCNVSKRSSLFLWEWVARRE